MPAECKIAEPSGTPRAARLFRTLLRPEVATGVVNEISQRALTVPEARAIARPFFTRKSMTDADALAFVGKLKQQREITPAERQAIALSVTQSELISDEDVKAAKQWIEKDNPSLKTIESHAEELRKKTAPEPRLFPQVEPVKQSVREFHRNLQ
jgi:G3E family GTPase